MKKIKYLGYVKKMYRKQGRLAKTKQSYFSAEISKTIMNNYEKLEIESL